jgi:hypothetical protein
MSVTANPIDITTLAAVKAWAAIQSSNEDQIVQDAITAFSNYVLNFTGRGNADGSVPSTSPFNAVVSYDEFYDGNGNDRLLLRNWPIVTVTSVKDSGVTIPASSSTTSPGYTIDQDRKFLVLRYGGNSFTRGWGGYGYRGPQFSRTGWSLGTQNVEVAYTAGFTVTPFDLEMCARKVVSLNYKRRQRIDQKSQAMAGGAGTVSFYDWQMDETDMQTLQFYRRRTA